MSELRRRTHRRNMLLSILLCGVCAAMMLLPMQFRARSPYAFDVAADVDPAAAREAYANDGGDAELYRLLLALCRQERLNDSAFDADEFRACWRELYRRAKAGMLDLETIGVPEDTSAMLALLRDYGVTPAES